MLGWRLPRRCGTTPPSTHAEPWLSSDISAASISDTSTWRPRPVRARSASAAWMPIDREQAADEVDHRRAGLQRPPVGLAGDAHQPRHRLGEEVVAGQRARLVRPGPERGHRARHEARVRRRAASRRRAPSAPSGRAGRTRSARRRGRPAGAPARRRPGRRGRAPASACCGSGRGSTSPRRSRHGGPQARVSSPPSGRSTLTTSAPRSPSSIAASGPASTREKSATRMPSSGAIAAAH